MNAQIAAIVDASALVRYARLEGLAVGELLGEIEGDDGASLLGIPVTSLLTAYKETAPDDRARLIALATSPDRATVILSLQAVDALGVADLIDAHDQQTAHCIVETRRHLAQLATYRGDAVRRSLDVDLVLDLIEP